VALADGAGALDDLALTTALVTTEHPISSRVRRMYTHRNDYGDRRTWSESG
jgi:hypothetical protein